MTNYEMLALIEESLYYNGCTREVQEEILEKLKDLMKEEV